MAVINPAQLFYFNGLRRPAPIITIYRLLQTQGSAILLARCCRKFTWLKLLLRRMVFYKWSQQPACCANPCFTCQWQQCRRRNHTVLVEPSSQDKQLLSSSRH